ncbi:MAG: hypothetical protein ACRC5T_05195 [Cetobacterium sp.]
MIGWLQYELKDRKIRDTIIKVEEFKDGEIRFHTKDTLVSTTAEECGVYNLITEEDVELEYLCYMSNTKSKYTKWEKGEWK